MSGNLDLFTPSQGLIGLAELEDASVIRHVNFEREPSPPEGFNVAQADNEVGLFSILEGWVNRLLQQGASQDEVKAQIDPERITEHESSHKRAALMAGFSVVRFVVMSKITVNTQGLLSRRTNTQTEIIPAIIPLKPMRDITKLALASTIAAPEELSLGDINQLEAMGYTGPLDVAERVTVHNEGHSPPLMLPLSCS